MPMTPDAILGLGRKFMESRVLLTAAELDLFTLLTKNPMTAAEAADTLKATERGVTILLDAVASMGLLDKINGAYRCPPEVASILSRESPASMLPMVMHSVELWKRWSNLTDIVLHGTKKTGPSVLESDENAREAFIGAMHVVASRVAPGIVAAVKPPEAGKLLDIGGASGSYTQAFLEARPGMTSTLFDLAPVIEIARRRLAGTGLLERITLVAGNFYDDELPAGNDLALLSAIIHQNSIEQNIDLFSKIFRALKPRGRLVIRDHVMSPDRTRPASGAFFAVNMLVGTPGGSTYTFDEIRASLESAGFIRINLIQQDERMNGLVEGFKP
jgi:SAM-dependent methyltransferase